MALKTGRVRWIGAMRTGAGAGPRAAVTWVARARWTVLTATLLALAACTSTSGADHAAFASTSDGAAVSLVPTSAAVIAACAAELGTTFCTPAAAAKAAQACSARLTPAEQASCDPAGGCLVPYTPTRPGTCVAGPTYTALPQCATPVADDCAFYRSCLDAAHPCGAGGYALGFGEPICYSFIDHRAEFSPAGQQWLRGVRTCLQHALAARVAGPVTSCEDLADEAFASHTACYTAPGNSFCALPQTDVTHLAKLLLPYFDDPRVSAQIEAVAAICAAPSP